MISEIEKSVYRIPCELAKLPKEDMGFHSYMNEPIDLSMPEIPLPKDFLEQIYSGKPDK